MDINYIWVIVAPFATLALRAWINAIHDGYVQAVADGNLSWWDVRGLFILLFKAIPNAVKSGFTDFPWGTIIMAIIKMFRK
jgi:hypothetical protein